MISRKETLGHFPAIKKIPLTEVSNLLLKTQETVPNPELLCSDKQVKKSPTLIIKVSR